MKNYYQHVEVLKQFMEITVSNDLIWGRSTNEYSTNFYKECGYTVKDWSWYDGPIVQLQHDYYDLTVSYVACDQSYSFGDGTIFIIVTEIPKLSSFADKLKPNEIKLLQANRHADDTEFTDKLKSLSNEFTSIVYDLYCWISETNAASRDYIYTIEIYAEEGVNPNDL